MKSEVRVNVLNQPYGGFPWIDLPMAANENWYNAHNFYGDLEHLDAATMTDVQGFFKTFYAPNNAVLVVSGDFEAAQAKTWVQQYFAGIPSATLPPPPDLTEPRQEKEKRAGRVDPLATRPALGIAYHVPDRNTPQWYAFGLIDQLLAQGSDSLLYDELVRKRGLTDPRGGRHQLRAWQHVRLQRPDAVDLAVLPRHRHDERCGDRGVRRDDQSAAHPAGGRGNAGPGAGEDALGALRQPRDVRRVRPRQPARRIGAVR